MAERGTMAERGSVAPRSRRGGLARILLGTGVLLLLAGCAQEPDPEETVAALSEVTAEPEAPDAATEYSVAARPDPIVDPLECSPYLVVTVRGTGEPAANQLLTPVAETIAQSRPDDVSVIDLDYPASEAVKESATIGVRMLIDTLNVQAESCAEQRFILLGYSQGALVIGDALSAVAQRLVGETVGEVSAPAGERVLSIVLYGDPRFVGDEAFNAGSFDADTDGLLPRAAGALSAYGERIRDYCVSRDFVCQTSLDLDEDGHVAYFRNGMQQDGAAFVITRLDPVEDAAADDGAAAEHGAAAEDAAEDPAAAGE